MIVNFKIYSTHVSLIYALHTLSIIGAWLYARDTFAPNWQLSIAHVASWLDIYTIDLVIYMCTHTYIWQVRHDQVQNQSQRSRRGAILNCSIIPRGLIHKRINACRAAGVMRLSMRSLIGEVFTDWYWHACLQDDVTHTHTADIICVLMLDSRTLLGFGHLWFVLRTRGDN